MSSEHDAFSEEREYLEVLYARVSEIIGEKRTSIINSTSAGSHLANQIEVDALNNLFTAKILKLEESRENLCFGRFFLMDGSGYHIGKLNVFDKEQNPILIDWRSKIASSFYRSTFKNNENLALKRFIKSKLSRDNHIDKLSIFDEEYVKGIVKNVVLSDDSLLKDALKRERGEKMLDIVSTIESEQDRIMRSEAKGALIIDGAPGTGKTVVGLHRAAYLLYRDREKLSDSGVLIVGPNSRFLNYIDEVLPLLGEFNSELTTLEGIFHDYTVSYIDENEDFLYKNSEYFLESIYRVLDNLLIPPKEGVSIKLLTNKLQLSYSELKLIYSQAKTFERTYNARREYILRKILDKFSKALATLEIGEDYLDEELDEFLIELRSTPEVRRVLNTLLPPLSPEIFLKKASSDHSFWGDDEAGYEYLNKFSQKYRDGIYSISDLFIIDLLSERLGEYKVRLVDHHGEIYSKSNQFASPKIYGHLIIDEAQEISYLGWKVLARRVLNGSSTILGDFNQRTQSQDLGWDEISFLIGSQKFELEELKINYRTPREINDFSLEFLKKTGNFRDVESALEIDGALEIIYGEYNLDDIERKVLELVGRSVIITEEDLSNSRLKDIVTILSPLESKGLEFDNVILVEPTNYKSNADTYVALTRANKRLLVFSTKDLIN